MPEIKLVRFERTGNHTLGVLIVNGSRPFVTLEPPWLGNQKNISCIPEGSYDAIEKFSERFGRTFEIYVPGRDNIILHPGNKVKDTKGCVVVAMFALPASLAGERLVGASKYAFKEFINAVPLMEYTFTIT